MKVFRSNDTLPRGKKFGAGTTLTTWKKTTHPSAIGESWEISRLPEGPSLCSSGTLDALLTQEELPYLAKYIDAGLDLSIQVHPHDEYALAHEGLPGKKECWIVLAAKNDAGIYLGFKDFIEKSDLAKALKRGDDISLLLNFYPVSRGTFALVPPGTIHAIGRGVLLAEIQQNSPITYRIWDWGRQGSSGHLRPLHWDKAMAVLNVNPSSNNRSSFRLQHHIFSKRTSRLISSDDFTVDSFCLSQGESLRHLLPGDVRYSSLLLFEGSLMLETGDAKEKIDYHQSILINKDVQWVEIHCLKDSAFIIIS